MVRSLRVRGASGECRAVWKCWAGHDRRAWLSAGESRTAEERPDGEVRILPDSRVVPKRAESYESGRPGGRIRHRDGNRRERKCWEDHTDGAVSVGRQPKDGDVGVPLEFLEAAV